MASTPRASPSTARSTGCSGTSSWPRIPVSSRARRASIRPGRSPTRSAGSPTDMWSSASTHEGRAGHPASSGRAIPRSTTTSPSPWSGRPRNLGATARSGSWASPTTQSWPGPPPRASPSTWPPSSPGKDSTTLIATPTTTVGSSASSAGAGRSDRSTRSNMVGDLAHRSTRTRGNRWRGRWTSRTRSSSRTGSSRSPSSRRIPSTTIGIWLGASTWGG